MTTFSELMDKLLDITKYKKKYKMTETISWNMLWLRSELYENNPCHILPDIKAFAYPITIRPPFQTQKYKGFSKV